MEQKVHFKFQLAGNVIDVLCCSPATKWHCRDYLVDETSDAQLHIEINQADIEGERAYLLSKKDGDEPLEASSPEALERLVLCRRAAELLPLYDRVLFHCSALAMDGNGVLFTAKSGTGKSTHTGLWRRVFGERVVMINDDKPFLSIGTDEIRVYGSPWRGKHLLGENTSAPVKAICIVCRGEENRIERISPREALPMLLQQTYQPKQRDSVQRTMMLTDRLSRNVAIYRLYCNMEEEAALTASRGIGFNDEKG